MKTWCASVARSPSGTSADVALRSSVAPVHAAEVALGRDADAEATAAPAFRVPNSDRL
jgi:hypothetical protein